MRCTYLFLCLIISSVSLAQPAPGIAGRVVSAGTGLPLPNVSVFLNGTSKGTITDPEGRYRLTDIPYGAYELVFSSVGYTTQVKQFQSDQLPLTIDMELSPKAMELDSVTVAPFLKDGWRIWGRFFRENFIGTSDAAENCVIKNYKVLRFRHNKAAKKLEVYADEPLIIENKALGYRIQYQLEMFVHDWNSHSQLFWGYTLFEDLTKGQKRVSSRLLMRRQDVYKGSLMHFMRSLYADRLKKEGFEVQRLHKVPDPKNPVDSISQVSRPFMTADSLLVAQSDSSKSLFFLDYLQVTSIITKEESGYLRNSSQLRKPWFQRSVVSLLEEQPVTIQPNGVYYPPQNLILSEYWGWSEKVSHLLPWDYQEPPAP